MVRRMLNLELLFCALILIYSILTYVYSYSIIYKRYRFFHCRYYRGSIGIMKFILQTIVEIM